MPKSDEEIAAHYYGAIKEAADDHAGEEWDAIGLRAVWDAARAELLDLIFELVDRDDCWFDHHGGCQAHGFLSLEPGETCPHADAKALLAERTPSDRRSDG